MTDNIDISGFIVAKRESGFLPFYETLAFRKMQMLA